MSDELRAAAHEALVWYRTQSPHVAQRKQAQLLKTLASGVLAEHPADDAHKRLAKVREKLKEIVVTEGCDAGVVLLSDYGPTHYDAELKCQIYDHAYFSPLGDALVELAALAEGEG